MVNVKTLEDIITNMPGVKAAKIVGEEGLLKEIHVVANMDKTPKQIARDVETVVFASTGNKLDRKIISVAQIESKDKREIRSFKLEKLECSTEDKNFIVRVSIEYGSEDLSGEASGQKTSRNIPKIIGMSIINALGEMYDYAISMDDSMRVHLAGKEFELCHLTRDRNGKEESIVGCAECISDDYKNVAEAVLDALGKM
jgi:hypothetical protein